MKRIVIASALILLISGLAAQTPTPEQKKLGVFVGSWSGEGKVEANPFGKGGVLRSTMTCRWYPGGFHIVCDQEDNGPMGKSSGHWIYGYRPDKKEYVSFGIDSTGYADTGTARVDGNTWTFESSAAVGGKDIRFRTAVTISPTEIAYKGSYSEDGKTWKPQGEGKLTRVK